MQTCSLACAQESYHYMKYKRSENSLYIYADDIVPRHITCSLLMDYDTIAGGDKFGNLFMTRLPADTSTLVRGLHAQAHLCSHDLRRCRRLPHGPDAAWHEASARVQGPHFVTATLLACLTPASASTQRR